MNADLLFPIFLLLLASAYLFTTFEYVKIKRRYRKSQTELNDLTVTWCKAATNFRKWKDELLDKMMMAEIHRDEAIVKATHRLFEIDRLRKEYVDVAKNNKMLNGEIFKIIEHHGILQGQYGELQIDFKRTQNLNLGYQQVLEISYVEIEELKQQLDKRNETHNEIVADLKAAQARSLSFMQELETLKAVTHE